MFPVHQESEILSVSVSSQVNYTTPIKKRQDPPVFLKTDI